LNLDGGVSEILIPLIRKNEQFMVSYLYFPPITAGRINLYCKSDEGTARVVTMTLSQQPPRAMRILIAGLAVVGTSFLLYWVIKPIIAWILLP
jgi:hypothetical protein